MAVSEYLLKHDGKKHPLFAYPKKGGVSMAKKNQDGSFNAKITTVD